jgi:hypothetical protein
MGEQPPQERKVGDLCTPDIVDLPILNLAKIGRPFEIKTSTIRMVQHSLFTRKEDLNLHLQVFIQLCQTFNMDGVTRDQMRARLFPFLLLGTALQWFYSQLAEMVLTVKFRQPSHEFTFGVGMTFISYPLVQTLLV